MTALVATSDRAGDHQRQRRRYDSALRREQAAATRRRIVTAGSDLLRSSSVRDWRGLTVRAVAERAGVNERTVYRHFSSERGLRDAVMRELEEEAGIDLGGMELEDVADVATRTLRQIATFPITTRQVLDPTLNDANRRQRTALLQAVAAASGRWPERDCTVAAAMFDVLWSVATYERLVADWQLEQEEAIRAITWVIQMVERSVRDAPGPLSLPSTGRARASSGPGARRTRARRS